MRITVFGASGRTGVPLVRQALDRGHEVVAFVRSADRLPVDDSALTVVEGDVYSGEGVGEAVRGAGAVISVLGHTDGSPDDLLAVGGDNVLAAMDESGAERAVGDAIPRASSRSSAPASARTANRSRFRGKSWRRS